MKTKEYEYCQTTGKICYSSKKASEVLNWSKRRHKSSHAKVIPKRKYYCKDCGMFHLTSMSYETHSERKDGQKKKKYIKTKFKLDFNL